MKWGLSEMGVCLNHQPQGSGIYIDKELCNNVWCCFLGPDPKPELTGDRRTFRMWMDTNQYQQDMANSVQGAEVCTRRQVDETSFHDHLGICHVSASGG